MEQGVVEDLPESVLGTKEQYADGCSAVIASWEGVYARELGVFDECGDSGEIWFGKQCERRVVQWICQNVHRRARIIDLGSGNGHLLAALVGWDAPLIADGKEAEGYGDLVGVDYCGDAVELGKRYAASCRPASQIAFVLGDVLQLDTDAVGGVCELAIDKGTFDAISLAADPASSTSDSAPRSQARIAGLCRAFKASLARVVTAGSDGAPACLLITSCNWTKAELAALFAPEYRAIGEVEHPRFAFGGAVGQTVTTVAFERCI